MPCRSAKDQFLTRQAPGDGGRGPWIIGTDETKGAAGSRCRPRRNKKATAPRSRGALAEQSPPERRAVPPAYDVWANRPVTRVNYGAPAGQAPLV